MALPPGFLDDLRARTPLAPLIGRKTRLLRNGRQWKGCCPFHNEKTPSFYVYDDHFHCFGCGAHGDAITFLMRSEGAAFPEAVERLAAEAGMEVPKPTPQAAARERRARDLHGVLAAAEAAFRRRLHQPEGRAALDYLRRRGLTDETIARFGLGWSGEGRGALAAELKAEGIEVAQLIEAGLMKPRDPGGPGAGAVDLYFNRVMFPIRDRRSRVISFGGRVLGDGQPKYVNGPETELFRKRRSLYGLDLAREGAFRGAAVVVVEGYMDVIALQQAGFAGAVAPLGTALTADQLQALWEFFPGPIICFDGDSAGERAARHAANVSLPELDALRTLKFISLPQGEDPDSFVRSRGKREFHTLIEGAATLEGFLFEQYVRANDSNSAFGKAKILRSIDDDCRSVKDKIMSGELRSSLRNLFFQKFRHRTAKNQTREKILGTRAVVSAEYMRSSAMLMLVADEPPLLEEFEEDFGLLPMNADQSYLRQIITEWWQIHNVPESSELMDHIRGYGEERAFEVFKSQSINYKHLDKRYAAEAPASRDVWRHLQNLKSLDVIQSELNRLVQDFASETNSNKLRIIANKIVGLRNALDAILQR